MSSCVCLSVRPPASDVSAPTGRIFMKFDFQVFFETLLGKLEFHQNLTRINDNLHEDR